MDTKSSNGWNEWSKHVLKELERMNSNYEKLQGDITKINNSMVNYNNEVKHVKTDVEALEIWKQKIDEVMSPTQMALLVNQVDSHKTFKTQVVAAFLVVNFLWGVGIGIAKLFF
jgi:predicted nuclease with TOPRIM domain